MPASSNVITQKFVLIAFGISSRNQLRMSTLGVFVRYVPSSVLDSPFPYVQM